MKQKTGSVLRNQRGFTLVELMVVVVIVAILAAVAIPQYRAHLRKSNRVDGQAALLRAAQQVERARTTSMTYVGATIDASSEKGLYTLALSNLGAETYTITATATGSQVADTGCTTLTINQAGLKTPAACW